MALIRCSRGFSGPSAMGKSGRAHSTQPHPSRRLHGKQPPGTGIVRVAQRRRQTELQAAIRSGRVPKARRAYALFTQHWAKGVRPGTLGMKAVAARWRNLPEVEKRHWHEKAAKERQKQLEAAASLGVHIRGGNRGQAHGGMTPAAPIADDRKSAACPTPVQFGDFQVEGGAPIGQGSYGKVVRARHMISLQIVVLKIGYDAGGEDIRKELEIYNVLREQCLALGPFLQLLGGSCDPPCPWMAMPLVESGSLRSHIVGKSAINIEAVAMQLGWGLWHLHSCGILHLDVKPGNLLWKPAQERLVIIDFGCAERFNPELGYVTKMSNPACEEVVTAPYRAPELWLDKPSPIAPRLLRPATDAWSYGCVLYEVIVGVYLFDSVSTRRAWCIWHRGERPQTQQVAAIQGNLPHQWWPVIWHMCHPTADERPHFRVDVACLLANLRNCGARPRPAQSRTREPAFAGA